MAEGYADSTEALEKQLDKAWAESTQELWKLSKGLSWYSYEDALDAAFNVCNKDSKHDRILSMLIWLFHLVKDSELDDIDFSVVRSVYTVAAAAKVHAIEILQENLTLKKLIIECDLKKQEIFSDSTRIHLLQNEQDIATCNRFRERNLL